MRRAALLALSVLFFCFPVFARAKTLPELEGGRVIMEWKDFEKILKELLKEEPKEEKVAEPSPPVDYSFRSALLRVEIKDGAAEVKADYALDVLVDDKWVEVPVGGSSSGIHEVLVDGTAGLIANRSGYVSALLLGKAPHRLQVTYTVAAPRNPGPNSFSVQIARIPGAVVEVVAPSELSEISVREAVVTGGGEAGERQSIRAVAGTIGSLSVSYTVPVPEAKEGPKDKVLPKLYSTLELLVSIADEVTTATAVFNYDVKHAPVTEFKVKVPEGFDVVNVSGSGIGDRWRAVAGELAVPMNYEVQGRYTLTVRMEAKRDDASGAVVVPEVETMDAERESGFVAIETRDTLEVSVSSLDGLAAIDSSELPRGLRSRARYPLLYSFRFGKHPYAGTLAVKRHEDVEVLTATIDTVNLVSLFTDDGNAVSRAIYEIRNNKKQYIKINLPGIGADAKKRTTQVWSAHLDGQPVKPSINKDGQVLIPLKKSGAEGGKVSFTVEIIYLSKIPALEKRGKVSTVFPQADIPASEMLVTLYLPDKYEYEEFEGDLDEMEGFLVDVGDVDKRDISAGEEQRTKSESKWRRKSSDRALMRQMEMEREIADEIQKKQVDVYDLNAQVPDLGVGTESGKDKEKRPTGMLPVQFNVPLRGATYRFSKLLVMDEAPELSFEYKKLPEKPFPWQKVWTGVLILVLVLILAALIQAVRWLTIRVRREQETRAAGPGLDR